jgi:hypothetical protein
VKTTVDFIPTHCASCGQRLGICDVHIPESIATSMAEDFTGGAAFTCANCQCVTAYAVPPDEATIRYFDGIRHRVARSDAEESQQPFWDAIVAADDMPDHLKLYWLHVTSAEQGERAEGLEAALAALRAFVAAEARAAAKCAMSDVAGGDDRSAGTLAKIAARYALAITGREGAPEREAHP